jgi:hypothetical protein
MSTRETSVYCDDCAIAVINGVVCHEHGCPSAWKGKPIKCFECGCAFVPSTKNAVVCVDCAEQRT